jgi:hypothetical protein
LRKETIPVLDSRDHGARVDVVELVVEDPILFAVIYEEFAIGWDLGGLDRAQVCAKHASRWMLISELN